MTQDRFDATKIDYGSALYFLKLLYEKAIKITDVAVGDLIRLDSPLLNHYYAPTLFLINKLLQRKDFEALREGTKYLFPTLIGYEELDIEWEKSRSSAYAFFAKIEGKWFEAGKPTFLLPADLQKVFDDMNKAMVEYEKQRKETEKIYTSKLAKNKPFTSGTKLYTPNATVQAEVKELAVYSDGSIRYKGEPIEMRNQMRELCRLFIIHHNRLITIDDIREKIIDGDKQKHVPFSTIAKYVSELRKILQIHFHKDVFVNQKLDGWYFKP